MDGSLLESARNHAVETEQLGHLHDNVTKSLVESGALRLWVAQEYGGASVSVAEGLAAIEAISRADGASGWCTMIANTTALLSFRMQPEWADTIFGDPACCTGGFAMPVGQGRLVDGGLEVSGRWPWGSGTDHCTWIGAGVQVIDADGNRATTADGSFAPFVFMDPNDVELTDTWVNSSGLRGTASNDYVAEGAFVPEGRWGQVISSELMIDEPLGRFPFFGALAAGVAAVLIGLGARAVDELIELRDKTSLGSKRGLAERSRAQADLALAIANVEQARAYLTQVCGEMDKQIAADGAATEEQRVHLRMAACAAAVRAGEAVDLCYHAAGGAAVYASSPLQRVFRDTHVAMSHGMIASRTLEPLGRYSFGLDTDTTML